MKWIDIRVIAMELAESKPDVDPIRVRYTDLMQWIMALPGFNDHPDHCNEKILEAIQMAWLEEKE